MIRSLPARWGLCVFWSCVLAVPGRGQASVRDSIPVVRFDRGPVLARIISGAVGPDGRVCVIDDLEFTVHCLGQDGRPLWSVGRRGKGPGEFTEPYRIAVAPDRSVLVYDAGANALLRFGADGAFVTRYAMPVRFDQDVSMAAPRMDTVAIAGFAYGAAGVADSAVHLFALHAGMTHVRSFAPPPLGTESQKRLMFGPGTVTVSARGTLLYSRRFPNEVLEYTLAGRRIREVAGPVRATIGPDQAFEVGHVGTRRNIAVVPPTTASEMVGAAREGGGWWLVSRRSGVSTYLLDRYDPVRRRWSTPLAYRWPERIAVFGVHERARTLYGGSLCDAEPCLVRVTIPPTR